jgi:hypothetical protein
MCEAKLVPLIALLIDRQHCEMNSIYDVRLDAKWRITRLEPLLASYLQESFIPVAKTVLPEIFSIWI